MLPHAMKFKAAGVDTLQIEAKAMTEKEITAIVRAYVQAMKLPADLDEVQEAALKTQEGSDITRGHYFRGVL
jgi:putative protease